ncbi:MAG: hypothetical protein JWQ90_4442 [Hydrocarboniphaga sp.]|nr:hypothetical protein [Hydrocarboniphaga sp.]
MLTIAAAVFSPPCFAQDDDEAAVQQRLAPLLDRFVSSVDALSGYSVIMTMQQRIGGELKPTETLLMKHRRKPECRYLKWIAEPHKGREVILCTDRDGGKLRVHQPGLLGLQLLLSPDDLIVTSGNLRPISQSGIFNMAQLIRNEGQRRAAGSRDGAPLPMLSERSVDGQASLCVHRDQGAAAGDPAPYEVGASELCLAWLSAMPTDVKFWNTRGQLMEHYGFRDYELDPELGELQFDTRNPDYHF